MQIHISEHSEQPIYQQIVSHIEAQILSGKLPAGAKLPTIRMLAKKNQVSLGTVKHAYDTLLQMGLTEMTQGKGTFVCESEKVSTTSKKELAMLALDHMIAELSELNFTHQEIRIYFDLKMREHELDENQVKVGIIAATPETLAEIHVQLSTFENIDLVEYNLGELLATPDLLRDDLHLYLTTPNHRDELIQLLGREETIMQIALGLSSSTIVGFSKIAPDKKVGVLAVSRVYAKMISEAFENFTGAGHPQVFLLGEDKNLKGFIEDKEILIGFSNLYKFASSTENTLIQRFTSNGGRYLSFGLDIDKGSLLYLGDRIRAVFSALNSKK